MRLSDIIIIILAIGGLFAIFSLMINDSVMLDYYGGYDELNLTNRRTAMQGNDTPFYMIEQSIEGQKNASQSNAESIQDDLAQASKNEIGLLSIPGAVLDAMKAIFNVFSFKWFNTLIAGVEQLLGLQVGTLGFLRTFGTIMLWTLIFLFVGAILRWKT